MAFPIGATLAEVRQEVAIRLGMGGQVDQTTFANPLLDLWIAQALRELEVDSPWVIARSRLGITLQDGVAVYDLPDGYSVGSIEGIEVVDTSDPPVVYPVESGVRFYERSAYDSSTQKGLPLRWELVDQSIRLLPPPDTAQYPTMYVTGQLTLDEPKNDDDRITLDKLAVVLRAELLGREHFGLEVTPLMLERYASYVTNMRASVNGTRETFNLGGNRSVLHNRPKRRFQAKNDNGSLWWENYHPPLY